MYTLMIAAIIAGCIMVGFLASNLITGSSSGIRVNFVLGFFGAVLGGLLLKILGFPFRGGILWLILVATIGAVIILWFVRLVRGRKV